MNSKFFSRSQLALSIAASLISVGASVAQAAPTFGAEFNFSNSKIRAAQTQGHIVNNDQSEAARDALMRQVMKVCEGCRSTVQENDYGVKTWKITYPDGWYFMIATDPAVVEIQTKPSTTDEIAARRERIQKDIFDSAAATGLLPSTQSMGQTWAGAHIHVGALSALGQGQQAVRRLRDFMVDFSNHAELAEGIFTRDSLNAPPLYQLPPAQRTAFENICADVDAGRIRSINTFAKRIRSEVYNVTLYDVSPTTKYQAFNVNRIGDSDFEKLAQTFELRAMRGQESAMDFLIETRLIEARLEYLARLDKPLAIQLPVAPMNYEQQAENFYKYVTETGLDFTPYEKFLSTSQKIFLPAIRARNQTVRSCRSLFI